MDAVLTANGDRPIFELSTRDPWWGARPVADRYKGRKAREPAMVWGPAQLSAKSMIAQQVAADGGCKYVDVRALLLDPVDRRAGSADPPPVASPVPRRTRSASGAKPVLRESTQTPNSSSSTDDTQNPPKNLYKFGESFPENLRPLLFIRILAVRRLNAPCITCPNLRDHLSQLL